MMIIINKRLTVGRRGAGVEAVQVVSLAQDAAFVQGELFAGAQLASAGVASEAGQVIDVLARPPHPVGGRNGAAAPGALCTKRPG